MSAVGCQRCGARITGESPNARLKALDLHVRAEHPSFSIRVVGPNGETMSSVGPFEGKPPAAVAALDGKPLDAVAKSQSKHSAVARLKGRFEEHERKVARSLRGNTAHDLAGLTIQLLEG